MSNEPNGIVWLDFDPEKIGTPRKLEYGFKNLMVSLRAVLETRIGADREILLTANAELKLPVIGSREVSARSLSRVPAAGSQSFETYAEKVGDTDEKTRIGSRLAPSPSGGILNALLLPHALEQSWRAEIETYAAWFVTGSDLHGLRLDRAPGDSSGRALEARAMRVREPLSEEGWKMLAWEARQVCEIAINPATKIVEEISYRHSALGSIRLPLKSHSHG